MKFSLYYESLKNEVARILLLSAICSACLCAQTSEPIQVVLDLTDAPRKILRAHLTIPVKPGPVTLVYPTWIPGEHSPSGPIDNLAGLTFTANGKTIPWVRDDVNMFAFKLDVPDGVTAIEAQVDFLATAAPAGFSAGASTNPNLAVVSWNEVALYPAGMPAGEVKFAPSIKLPEGWKYASALRPAGTQASVTKFEPETLETLVDSPVLAGKFFRQIDLAPELPAKHSLNIAADGPEDLALSADDIEGFHDLIREANALYQSRHYDSYHFLLTLSDTVAHFGLEHHQSSDDRTEARLFLDDDLKLINAELLPHEFTHSWNGKYRRPAGLATPNFQKAMKGELLWVYEGLTEYLGTVLTVRCGLWNPAQFRDMLAANAAEMDHRPGRTWRNLQDTATSAQILYSTSQEWDNWRRSVDYYPEGALVWLDVDTTIRKLSGGKRSLNDFCVRFLGQGGNTKPEVAPYTIEDIYSALNAVEPFNWKSFLQERLTSKAAHAPLGGITQGGYKLEYSNQTNEYLHAGESRDHGVNAWYSLGFRTGDEAIRDVLVGSPAYEAGLGPGMKLIAINGRRATDELLRNTIRDSKNASDPIEFIVENAGFFKTVKIDYHGGERYPHLVRDEKTAALLDDIVKPLVAKVRKKTI